VGPVPGIAWFSTPLPGSPQLGCRAADVAIVKLTATLLVAMTIFVGGAVSGTGPAILTALHAVQVAGGMVSRVGHALAAAGTRTQTPYPRFDTCDELHRRYPHGVGRSGAHDLVPGTSRPVASFVIDTAVYQANRKRLDRDHDGIACERP
jgi:excalibur calcium-binding domain-containing protein